MQTPKSIKKSKARRKYQTQSQHKRRRPSYLFTQTQKQQDNKNDIMEDDKKMENNIYSCAALYILKCNEPAVMAKLVDATSIFHDIDNHLMVNPRSLPVSASNSPQSYSKSGQSQSSTSTTSSRNTQSHTHQYLTVMSIEVMCSIPFEMLQTIIVLCVI